MIDEKKLMSHIEKQYREWGEEYDAEQILGDIEDFPKVGEWIPCSERLPEINECVLISYRSLMKWDKEIYSDQIAIRREDGWHWWDELETKVKNEIVAWQSLPEPYEVKENERP